MNKKTEGCRELFPGEEKLTMKIAYSRGVVSKQARRSLQTPCLSSFCHSNLYETKQPFKLKTHFAFNFKKYIYFCS